MIGELSSCRFRSGIDRRTAFIDHDHLYRFRERDGPDKGFRFSAGRTVSHRDGFNLKLFTQGFYLPGFFKGLFFRHMGENRVMMKQLALPVQADDFASGSESRVYSHHTFCAQWRGEQKLAKIFHEHPDGFSLGPFFCGKPGLGFHGTGKKAFVAVLYGQLYLGGIISVPFNEQVFEYGYCRRFIRQYVKVQDIFFFAPPDGEHPVRRNTGHRLVPFKIVSELHPLFRHVSGHAAFNRSLVKKEVPQPAPCRIILIDDFRYNVSGSGQRIFHGLNPLFGIDERLCRFERICAFLLKDFQGERFKPFFLGHDGSCPPFGFKRKIYVLEHRHGFGGENPLPKLIGQMSVFFKRFKDGVLPISNLPKLIQPVPDNRDSDFIKAFCGFFSVSRNKGDGGSFSKKGGHRLYLMVV